MNNTLAIFYDSNYHITPGLKHYIDKIYTDYFYIIDSITIKNIQDTAILHYTDVRMRGIDILLTDIRDINKVSGFHNKLIYYYNSRVKIMDKDFEYIAKCISNIDCVLYDNTINKSAINNILNFNGDIINVSQIYR